MDFSTFANILYINIGKNLGKAHFTRNLFLYIIGEDEEKLNKEYPKEETFLKYFTGKLSISKISKTFLNDVDKASFEGLFKDTTDDTMLKLCELFSSEIPDINAHNAPEKLATLFHEIMLETANFNNKKTNIKKVQNTASPEDKYSFLSDMKIQYRSTYIKNDSDFSKYQLIDLDNEPFDFYNYKNYESTLFKLKGSYDLDSEFAFDGRRTVKIHQTFNGIEINGFTSPQNWISSSYLNRLVFTGHAKFTGLFKVTNLEGPICDVQFFMIGDIV